MILLLAACSPVGRTFTEQLTPGGYAVFVDLRAIVVLPADALQTEAPVEVRITPEDGPGALEATDGFAQARILESARRFYRVEIDVEALDEPMWIGRWDDDRALDGVGGTLYTAVETSEGWRAEGHFDAPGIDVDPVLLHPDRTWFPTTSTSLLHGTAGTTLE